MCAVLRTSDWISDHLKNEVPVQFVTAVRSWRDDEPDFRGLQVYNVVRLWLRRKGLPSSLGAFLRLLCTLGDNLLPLHNSCNFDVVALSEGTGKSCVFAVQKYLWSHSDPKYDLLPDSVVPSARGVFSRVVDLYHPLDYSPWADVEDES